MVEVHFDWQKLPIGWSLATSFGTDDRCQSFHGLWHDAKNSLFVGGDYRVDRTEISGNVLNFAIRGTWSFTDEDQRVSGVEPGSEAWKAGLRDGQQRAGWSIHNGDPSKEVRLRIHTGNGEQVLRYYPRGPKVSIQRFTLDSLQYSSHPEMCTAELHSSP